MSVILEGIDLPTNGETLIVGIYGNGNVSIEYSKPLALAIEPNAQAIQIPKEHGKLIGGDELLRHLKKDLLFSLVEQYGISGVIESRPSTLEAEP